MKIVLTTQPPFNSALSSSKPSSQSSSTSKSLLLAKQPLQSFQEPVESLQQPFLTASQPSQIERVTTLFHQNNREDRVASAPAVSTPVVQYQAIEELENRLLLETLIGVDIYV